MTAIDVERLLAVEPDEPTLRHLREVVGTPIVLWIGEEGAERVVAAMHVARTYFRSRAQLVCTIADVDGARVVRRQVNELALPNAHVVVAVDERVLAACVRAASVVAAVPALAAAFDVPALEIDAMTAPTTIARALIRVG